MNVRYYRRPLALLLALLLALSLLPAAALAREGGGNDSGGDSGTVLRAAQGSGLPEEWEKIIEGERQLPPASRDSYIITERTTWITTSGALLYPNGTLVLNSDALLLNEGRVECECFRIDTGAALVNKGMLDCAVRLRPGCSFENDGGTIGGTIEYYGGTIEGDLLLDGAGGFVNQSGAPVTVTIGGEKRTVLPGETVAAAREILWGSGLDLRGVADSGDYQFIDAGGNPAGFARWDAGAKSLTLRGARISAADGPALLLPGDCTLLLEGENLLRGAASGNNPIAALYAGGGLSIRGDGGLDARGPDVSNRGSDANSFGIYVSGALAIRQPSSGRVTAAGGDCQSDCFARSIGINAGDVTIGGDGRVEASGGSARGGSPEKRAESNGLNAYQLRVGDGARVEASGGESSGGAGCSAGLDAGFLELGGTADVTASGGTSQLGESDGARVWYSAVLSDLASLTAWGGQAAQNSAGLFIQNGGARLATGGALSLEGGDAGAGFVSAGLLADGDVDILTGGEHNRFIGVGEQNGYGLYSRSGRVRIDLAGGSAEALYRVMFDGESWESLSFDAARAVYPGGTLELGANTRREDADWRQNDGLPGLLFTYRGSGEDGPSRSGGPSESGGSNWYVISASAGPGGSISPEGRIPVTEGKDQGFVITPDEGHVVSRLVIDSRPVAAAESYTFRDVRQGHTIYAAFERGTAALSAAPATTAESNPKMGARP